MSNLIGCSPIRLVVTNYVVTAILLNGLSVAGPLNVPAANAGSVVGAVTVTTTPPGGSVAAVTLFGPDGGLFALTNGGITPCNLIVGASNILAGSYQITLSAGEVNPPSLFGANLVGWYRADLGVGLSGSNVTSWGDQSGNRHDLSIFGSPNPTFSSTGFNTVFPGISFVAGNSSRLTSAAFNLSTANIGAFMVARITGSGSDARVLAYADTAVDFNQVQNILFLDSSGANTLRQYQDSISIIATAFDNTNYRLGSTFDSASNQEIFVNNISAAAGLSGIPNTLGSSTSVLSLGANLTGGSTCPGMTVAEVVLLNIVPSSSQRTNLDNYFKSLWGL